MSCQFIKIKKSVFLQIFVWTCLIFPHLAASDSQRVTAGNFGLPGVIDLPTAKRFKDGKLVINHQNHNYLFMAGISFQALPYLGLSFRYGGHGKGGYAQGRVNWDSFNAHISVVDEGLHSRNSPASRLLGTGWYSSESC